MGLPLIHPARGEAAWFDSMNSNWTTLENSFVARKSSDTSNVTVSSTTAETALMANTSIEGAKLTVGAVINSLSSGTLSVAAFTNPTFTWRLRWGGIGGAVLYTWNWSVDNSGGAGTATSAWIFHQMLILSSLGVSGSAAQESWSSRAQFITQGTGAPVTFDSSSTKTLLWTVQPSLSSASVTQRQMVTTIG